jgi:Negative regulator of sigma E activity
VLRTLGQWYHFRDLGPTRIAGRSCDGVEVVPRDQYRFGYQVWVDTQTHVPLRVNLIGKADSVLEQVMFTEISFPANIPDSAFRPKIDTSKFRVLTRNLPDADNGPDEILTSSAPIGWTFGSLPPGFQETLHDVRTLPGAGGKVDHMLVSDGLSAVSVFIAPDSPKNRKGEFRGISRIGAVEAYGRVVDGHQVTVVGEVPEITVRLIGDAVKRVATGGATTEAKAGTH